MRPRLRQTIGGNRRAQAWLIALLYVFLCTFGALTHTHAPLPVYVGGGLAPIEVDEEHVHATDTPALCAHNHSRAPACFYCEWLAAGVSPALTHPPIPSPVLVSFPHAPLRPLAPRAAFLARFSSRAPPVS